MSAPQTPVATPRAMRNLALLSMALASMVGMFSCVEANGLSNLHDRPEQVQKAAQNFPLMTSPELAVAMAETQAAVLEGMKDSRGFILGALSVVCVLIFACARWLIVPAAVPREGVRRILSFSLLAAAFLRTADGAQTAVVTQRVSKAIAPMLEKESGGDPMSALVLRHAMPTITLAMSVGLTIVIAGAFLLLGQYFRSQRVRQVVALQDQALERD